MNHDDPSKAFSLAGEVALITGGGTGLGLATARCFVASGARVVIVGRRADVLEEAATGLGPSATAIPADLTQLDRLPGVVADIEQRVGAPSILVNNAGIHFKALAVETADDDMARVLGTHVQSAFALARESAQRMLQRKRGSIIFIGSMTALFGIPKVAAYSTAKSAVVGLTRALATEWAPDGIRVNAIVPGWIETPMLATALQQDPERRNRVLSRTPMQRLGEPEDVGWAAVYLSSPAAKFVTGTALVVDGGAAIGF